MPEALQKKNTVVIAWGLDEQGPHIIDWASSNTHIYEAFCCSQDISSMDIIKQPYWTFSSHV